MSSDQIKLRGITYTGKALTRLNLFARPTLSRDKRAEIRANTRKDGVYVGVDAIYSWEYIGFLIIPNEWSTGLDRRLSLTEVEQWTNGQNGSTASLSAQSLPSGLSLSDS